MSTANDCYYTMNYRMTTVMMPPVLLSSTPSLTTSRSSSENCEQYTMLGLNNAILVLIHMSLRHRQLYVWAKLLLTNFPAAEKKNL